MPRELFFFKNYTENDVGKIVPDRFKKALYYVKASDLQLDVTIFR